MGRRWQMTMDKIIVNIFTIWQMTMGKINTFAMNNFTFPSFVAPNTSSATSCVKLLSCVLHVSPKGRRGGTRVLPGPSLRCPKKPSTSSGPFSAAPGFRRMSGGSDGGGGGGGGGGD